MLWAERENVFSAARSRAPWVLKYFEISGWKEQRLGFSFGTCFPAAAEMLTGLRGTQGLKRGGDLHCWPFLNDQTGLVPRMKWGEEKFLLPSMVMRVKWDGACKSPAQGGPLPQHVPWWDSYWGLLFELESMPLWTCGMIKYTHLLR